MSLVCTLLGIALKKTEKEFGDIKSLKPSNKKDDLK